MRASWSGKVSGLAVGLGLFGLVATACTNTVGKEPDAGVIGAEGEGEAGEGEGEGEAECGAPVIALIVVVKDNVTQFPICDATVVINDGAFTETLTPGNEGADCDYSSAPDRIGLFDIVVTHPDYQQGGLDGVRVNADACGHAILRRAEVRLDV